MKKIKFIGNHKIILACNLSIVILLIGVLAYLRSYFYGTTISFESHTYQVIITSLLFSILLITVMMLFFVRFYHVKTHKEEILFESEKLVKKFLDSIPVGVLIIDGQGKSYFANTAAHDILGKEGNAIETAKDVFDINKAFIEGTNTVYPINKRPLARALAGEKNVKIEDMEILKEDEKISLKVSATCIKNELDKVEFAIAVYEDTSELKNAYKEILSEKEMVEKSALSAAESALLKETFLANMSHEIRTPLNAIIGFTNLLLKRRLGEQENDFVQTIKSSGESLLRIINDVLDVSKMSSGSMDFEERPFNINEIFGSLEMIFSQKVKEKNLNLSFICDKNIPEELLGDTVRLNQIISNLVGNSIKFTKKGLVEVNAKMISENDQECLIEIYVLDTGIGIANNKLDYIFQRFQQAEAHTSRNYGGTGLGLSIARQLVEMQGGELTVKSIEELGSVFSFTLPFKKLKEAQTIVKQKDWSFTMKDIAKLKILVVEDNLVNIKFIESLFADYDIKADVAVNGKEAIEKLAAHNNYDLVLMDIEMPEMSGYDATFVIRKELNSNVPIIAMTAHAMAGEKEKCLKVLMNDYISKPIDPELLFEKMFKATSVSKLAPKISPVDKQPLPEKNNPADRKESGAKPVNTTISFDKIFKAASAVPVYDYKNESVMDLTFFYNSLKNKKDVILNLIDVCLKQMPEDLFIMNNAIETEDYPTIGQVAHKMKSTAVVMGISVLYPILDQIEMLGTEAKNIEKINILNHQSTAIFIKAVQEIEIEKSKLLFKTNNLPAEIDENKILLVEDNVLLRKSIAAFLKENGFKIVEADNGQDAIEAIRKNKFSLMVIDLKLPQIGGLEVIEKVRNEFNLSTPIIVLTSSGVEQVELESFNLGANEFIAKPFSLAVLQTRIDKLIEGGEKQLPPNDSNQTIAENKKAKAPRQAIKESGKQNASYKKIPLRVQV